MRILALVLSSAILLASVPARAEIGTIQFALGDVRVTDARGSRAVAKGDQINEGDSLAVGASGSAQIKMVDGGFIAVRPDTQMKFDQYKWSGKEDGSERGLLSLVRGGFRTITGGIGRVNKENLTVNTPTATVGIRGTDHEVLYVPSGGPVTLVPQSVVIAQAGVQIDVAPLLIGRPETLVPMLLAQAGPGGGGAGRFAAPPGTFNKVNVGLTRLTSAGISIVVRPNQVGHAPLNQAPRLLPAMPSFMRTATPPRPAQQQTAQGQGQGQGQQGQGQGEGQQGQQGGQGQGGQQGQQQAQQGQASGGGQQQAAAEPIRSSAVVDNPTQVAAASATANEAAVVSPVATTTVVAVTPVSTGGGSSSSSSSTSTTTTAATPVTLQGPSGLTVNLTENTVKTSSGATVDISQGAVAEQADIAAAAAAAAATALNTLLSSNPAITAVQLPTVIASASPLVTAAQTANTSATALNVGTAASAATSSAATALATTNAANTVFTANGAFADATLATPAQSLMSSANSQVQSAAGTVTSSAAALTAAQASGSAKQTAVTAALNAANSAGATLTLLGLPTTTTAQSQLTIAQNAATLAQSAAAQAKVYQDAGNFSAAQNELTFAQQQQAIAVKALSAASAIITGITAAQTAQTGAGTSGDAHTAGTVYGFANAAQAAVSAVLANATTVSTQAAIVATNAPLTQFSNPAVASPPNGFVHLVLASKPASGSVEQISLENNLTNHLGNNYVLDGGKSLVQLRDAEQISAQGYNYVDNTTDTTVSLAHRFIKFAGGTAQNVFKAPDNSLYMGRWQGGSMDIYSDIGTSGGNTLLESIPLGTRSAHWLVAEAPPLLYTQKLIGTTNFSLVASTQPTDSLGNVGVLNSASLSANFSSLTVQAGVNLSIPSRGINIVATTPDVPLDKDGGFFVDTSSANPLVINGCGGMACTGYHGGIKGGIAGATAGGAAFGYGFNPNIASSPPNTPFADQIQGLVAFSATAPTVGTNPTPVGSTGQYRTSVFYSVDGSNGAKYLAVGNIGGTTSPTSLPNTAFVLDAAGNLIHVLGASWNVFNAGTATQCLGNAPCLTNPAYTGASPSPDTASSILAMGAGTLGTAGITFNANGDRSGTGASEFYNDTVNGFRFGRYQGGFVNASTSTGGSADLLTNLGSNSVLWQMREIPASIPVSGTFHYLPTFATAPTDNFGHVGTLNYATLEANFSRQTVNTSVSLDIAGVSLRGRAEEVPIAPGGGRGFDVSTSPSQNATFSPAPPFPISSFCSGTCPALPFGASTGANYGARFSGFFGGDGVAGGAELRYTFNTYYDASLAPGSAVAGAAPAGTVPNQYINGYVGFSKGPQVTVPAGWGKAVSTSFYYFTAPLNYGVNDFMSGQSDGGPTFVSTFAGPNGNLSAVSNNNDGSSESLTIGGVTTGASTVTSLANGISFGRYDAAHAAGPAGPALTLTGNTFGNTFSNTPVLGSLQWIAGPNLWPIFVSSVSSGTASYSVSGNSLPTDQNGTTGTFNSASLFVNFNTQSVNTALSVTMPANTLQGGSSTRAWTATANNIRLDDGGGFHAGGGNGTYAHQNMTVNLNGNTSAFGNINGQLTGALMNGATLAYTLAGNDPSNSNFHEHVNGVIGFGSPTFSNPASQDPLQGHRIRLAARGTNSGLDATTGAIAAVSAASLQPDEYLTRTAITAVDSGRILSNTSGGITDFDAQGTFVSGISGGVCSPNCSVNQSPVRISINPSAQAVNGTIPAMPAIASGAATIAEQGTDLLTGIIWGRYTNGNFAIVDRVTGLPVGTGNTTLGPINHYLYSGVQYGPTVLPTSGTFNYTLMGNTSPTDNAGSTPGTLTSATLVANFAAQTVNSSINAVVGGRTWTASASNMPILAGTAFEAKKNIGGGGTLTVGCSGPSCNAASLAGSIIGAFTGSTGQGAGIAYSLNTGGTGGITMGGVAAFRR